MSTAGPGRHAGQKLLNAGTEAKKHAAKYARRAGSGSRKVQDLVPKDDAQTPLGATAISAAEEAARAMNKVDMLAGGCSSRSIHSCT